MNVQLREPLWRVGMGLWFVATSVLLLMPVSDDLASSIEIPDKLVHAVIFGSGAFWWAIRRSGVDGLLGLVILGGLFEILQSTLTARTGDWWDWCADATGVGLGRLMLQLLRVWP